MTPITEQNNLGDLLKYEAPNRYSRDVATIAAGQNLPLGTVLGRNTGDGKHYAIDPAATNGTPARIATHENRVQHPGDAFAFSPAINGSVNPA